MNRVKRKSRKSQVPPELQNFGVALLFEPIPAIDEFLPALYRPKDKTWAWLMAQPELVPVLSGQQSFAQFEHSIAWVVPL